MANKDGGKYLVITTGAKQARADAIEEKYRANYARFLDAGNALYDANTGSKLSTNGKPDNELQADQLKIAGRKNGVFLNDGIDRVPRISDILTRLSDGALVLAKMQTPMMAGINATMYDSIEEDTDGDWF